MNVWLAIFLGGGLGSVARFGVSRLFLLFAAGNIVISVAGRLFLLYLPLVPYGP